MAHSFIELDKAVIHVSDLVLCDCGFHSVCLLMRIGGLWKLPDGRDWLWGKLGLTLVGKAMLSKSLTQISADGWGYVPLADGIPAELFQSLKGDAVKMLPSLSQQIWKTQQWPQD